MRRRYDRPATVVEFVERGEGVFGIVGFDRPVNVEQIDGLDAKAVETLLGACDHVVVCGVHRKDFRGNKDVLAWGGRGGDPVADGFFVAVHLCSIDMEIASLDGYSNVLGTLVEVIHTGGAEPER